MSVTAAPEPEANVQNETEDTAKLQRKAYTNATTLLREEHRKRFEELREQESQKLGVPYKRRPTASEKAEEKLRALLAEHPELRERVAPPA